LPPARVVSAAALWALYMRAPAARRAALVPGGLLFHNWEVADMAEESLRELEARGHTFLACTSTGARDAEVRDAEARDADAGVEVELVAFAVLTRSKRVRGDSFYAALFAAPDPAAAFVPLLLHLFAVAAGPACPPG
jgi:hypothetical protein